ncbi:MAG: hypothetical protein IPL46_00710 [Saprospiraceae bacterium]|nr:hypothetical protein [Saprospiraceae bacterium]
MYSLYLKGLYTYKEQNFDRSIDYNQQAVAIDSQFAPSYAFMALAKIWKINRSGNYADFSAIREAKEFAGKSVNLDPNLAEGYSALALLGWIIELDFPTSKVNFERSIELNPSSSLIKNRYAYFLLWMGEFDKAEMLGLDAISSDPADWNGYVIVSNAYIYKGEFKEAEKYIAEGRKLFPKDPGFESLLINSNFYSSNYGEVVQTVELLISKDPSNVSESLMSLLSISFFKMGNLDEANNIMQEIRQRPANPNSNIDYNFGKNIRPKPNDGLLFRKVGKIFHKERTGIETIKN